MSDVTITDIMVRAVLMRVGLSSYHQGLTRATAAYLGEGAVNRPHGRGGIVTTLEEVRAQRAEREHADYCDHSHCYCDVPF